MLSEGELTSGLSYFCGDLERYHHWMRRFVFTPGVKYLADNAEAYWLLDAIGSHQTDPKVKAEEFQVWTLKVDLATSKAELICTDGNENRVTSQKIPFTTFPMREVTLWLANWTLYLPDEH